MLVQGFFQGGCVSPWVLTGSCQGAPGLSGGAGISMGTSEHLCCFQGQDKQECCPRGAGQGGTAPQRCSRQHLRGFAMDSTTQPDLAPSAWLTGRNRWNWRVVREPWGRLGLPELGVCE